MRDDFSKQTLDVLAKRVGVRCSNPSCRKLTTGPRIESHHIVNIGVGAHITAASPGGPRFDPGFAPEQRQSPENGIWLCQNCAKLVDNDPTRYAVEILNMWKLQAEKAALDEVEGIAQETSLDLSAEIELSYSRERIESERHDYRLQVKLTNRGIEPIGPYFVEVEMPACVIHRPEDNPYYIPDRSSRRIAFFRFVSENQGVQVYPGDTNIIFSINYYMNHDIYFKRGNLFQIPVRVKLYRRGLQPITLEKPFGDLQIF
jgi:hypothetical protein